MNVSRCDICDTIIEDEVFDAKTKAGPWAFMCPDCFKIHTGTGGKLGLGLGQQYKRVDGKFVKVAG